MCGDLDSAAMDADLVRRLQAGDVSAFDEIFARHRGGLLAFLEGLSGDRGMAEDVAQESFVELAKHIRRINPEQGVSGWLYRTARNRAIDMLRRRKRVRLPGQSFFRSLGALADDRGAPWERMQRREAAGRVLSLLDTLPLREREVLAMRFLSDLKFREVAQALGRPLGTVLWQARRGLRRLREAYDEKPEKM